MKTTWKSSAAVSVLTVLFGGCMEGQKPSRLFWRVDEPVPAAAATNDKDASAAPGVAENQTAASDDSAEPMDPRVRNYIGRFPPNDADRGPSKRSNEAVSGKQATGDGEEATANVATTAPPASVQPVDISTPPKSTVTAAPAQDSSPRNTGPLYQPPMVDASATPGAPAQTNYSPALISRNSPAGNPPVTQATAASPQLPSLAIELTDVRAAPMRPVTIESAPPEAVPNTAIQSSPTDPLSTLVRELEQAVKDNPRQIDDQIKLRLWYLFSSADDKACAPLTGPDPLQGELLTAAFRAMSKARQLCLNPQASSAEALAAVDELRRVLGQQAPVSIPSLALVTRVRSFGDYDAVQPPAFSSGSGMHVYLYTEIDNFRYEPTGDGKLRSTMAEEVQIWDAQGKMIWSQKAPEITETVLRPRRDFFIPFEIRLPADTPDGSYVLKVTIEDKIGATTDQKRLTFTIGDKKAQ